MLSFGRSEHHFFLSNEVLQPTLQSKEPFDSQTLALSEHYQKNFLLHNSAKYSIPWSPQKVFALNSKAFVNHGMES